MEGREEARKYGKMAGKYAGLGVVKGAGRKPERGIKEKIRKEEAEKAEKMAELGVFKRAGRKPVKRASLGGRPQ